MKFAIVDTKTNLVVSVVEADDGYAPGEGFSAFEVDGVPVSAGGKRTGGKFSALPEQPQDLEASRSGAMRAIDVLAEQARLEYITPGMGQSLTYQAKADELRRYDTDPSPAKVNYPFLAAEIGVTGSSLSAVADAVRGALSVWTEKGPLIEHTRLKAKAEISKADSVGKIDGIVSAIVWP